MRLFVELLTALLAAVGLVCLYWLAFGRLVLPVGGRQAEVTAVVAARGAGEGLEQAVCGLIWLRSTGLWRGRIRIARSGLTGEGLALARRLADRPGVELEETDERV